MVKDEVQDNDEPESSGHPLMNDNRMLVSIYKSVKKDEMYLYIPKLTQFKEVPQALMDEFGTPEYVMDLLLKPEKKLARADMNQVMLAVGNVGYYLQMPPSKESTQLDTLMTTKTKG